MKLPRLQKIEEEQNYRHQLKLVRSLLDKDYSESQIIGLADVDELGLDLETVKDILSYERINRGAAKVMGKKVFDFGKYLCKEILEGCFTAPSYYLKHAKDNNPPTGLFGTFAYLGSAAGSGYEYFSDSSVCFFNFYYCYYYKHNKWNL
jgi:hypothetical protein